MKATAVTSLWVALATIAFTMSVAVAATDPVVQVEQGSLRGSSADGLQRFFGIPFAAAPVGHLRWREPQPPQSWKGVRRATEFGNDCIQGEPPSMAMRARKTSEDCLYLNIWTSASASSRLPVMVWIHGGGFLAGSGAVPIYDGQHFARKGVVLVTINYRLGALGFMAHSELSAESPHKASGNYGILDQIAALKWIRANIASFGGDPDNVTIFGESAGSTAISILQASPLATGLFHRVIGQSTSQFDPDGGLIGRKDMRGAEAYGEVFAKSLGASSIVELRAMYTAQLLAKPPFFWPTERDGYVLPDIVYNIFAAGKHNDVPTLVGSNSQEGTTIKVPWVRPEESERAEYDRIYGSHTDPLEQSSTDAIQWQMRSWAHLQAKTGDAKSWLYWFTRATPGRESQGASHGSEMIYVFKTLDAQDSPWTDDDRKVSELMSDYWVNFARNGDPNGPGVPRWPSYSIDAPMLMELGPQPRLIPTPRPQAQAFLDSYFDKRR